MWEEPCISGEKGSGAVFFSGCPLRCCFCQNHELSAGNFGKEISVNRLSEIFLELQEQGAHNINLVSPTQYVPWIIEALDISKPGLKIPVVYNTGGYDDADTLKMLDGYVDIYLPDFKYMDARLSERYSRAPDYFEIASKAVLEMYRQTGRAVLDENGLMRRGLLVRHLVIPSCYRDSLDILQWIYENLPPDDILVSVMSQYTPGFGNIKFKEIERRVTAFEYKRVAQRACALGFKGYVQGKGSANAGYRPPFSLEGV
jgi:putative pyruvate formate lyase activating enzyme